MQTCSFWCSDHDDHHLSFAFAMYWSMVPEPQLPGEQEKTYFLQLLSVNIHRIRTNVLMFSKKSNYIGDCNTLDYSMSTV